MQEIKQPLVELPFMARLNPKVDLIETHVQEWSRRFKLVRTEAEAVRLAKSHVGHFAAYAYPDASLERANLAVEFFQWLYTADDQYESGACGTKEEWSAAIEAVRGVLQPGATIEADSAPLVRTLFDVSDQLDSIASPSWKRRFCANIIDTLVAALREIEMRDNTAVLSQDEYVPLRRMSGGCIPCLDLIEPCADLELSDATYYSPTYQEIFQSAVDVVCWTNDLYSLEKELACGITTNLVLVLENQHGLTRDQAVARTRSMITDTVTRMLRVQEQLPESIKSLNLDAQDEHALRYCVQALLDWVAGSNAWHASGTAHLDVANPDELPSVDLFLAPQQ